MPATFIVEVEGALGWRREIERTSDPVEARYVARRQAGHGSDQVIRVLREADRVVLLEVAAWSHFQCGPLADGSTAFGPCAEIPYAEATYELARQREQRALGREEAAVPKGAAAAQISLF